MAQFALEKRLPSSEVTLDLLKTIEQLVWEQIAVMSARSPDAREDKYTVAITDAFGTETLGSIRDFRGALLPDSTTELALWFRSSYFGVTPQITLRIAFNSTSYLNRFKVEVEGDDPRATAVAISDKLQRILEPHRRMHGFLHPNSLGGALLIVLGGAIVYSLLFALITKQEPVGLFAGAGVLLLIIYYMAGRLRPFVIFDSQASHRKSAVWNWFLYGSLTFLVFTTLAVAFRRRLLGF
jgi:hypothetical protein